MTVTSSTLPPRSATPVKVAPALVVLPFFTPAMPWYTEMSESPASSRLVFWISKDPRTSLFCLFFFVSPGNLAETVEQYSRKSFFCSPERANSVRSYADDTCPRSS